MINKLDMIHDIRMLCEDSIMNCDKLGEIKNTLVEILEISRVLIDHMEE